MKTFFVSILLLAVIGGVSTGGYFLALKAWQERNKVKWREAEVERGDIVSKVNATGEVKPILSVHIGSFVSGPVTDLYVEYNSEVLEGDILAEIDTRIYDAAVKRDEATLESAQAERTRVEAQLSLAKRNEGRAKLLHEENEDFVSQAELDQLQFATEGLEAQLQLAESSIKQAEANLSNSQLNLTYTKIESPVDGIVIDRIINPGQTLAAQFQTPELFVIGKDMRKKMHVYVSVDESEIGLIYDAKEKSRSVEFRVYAYPTEIFKGQIEEIRMSSTTNQNVVTYPVIVSVPNPDLKLIPGMTAEISFEVDIREDCLRVPNTALRFFPDVKHVRKEDKPLIEGTTFSMEESEDEAAKNLSAGERAESQRKRKKRHVWVLEGEKLRAIEVETGISDSRFTEVVAGELIDGQKLVTGTRK